MSKNMSTILDDNNSADDMEVDASRFTRPGVGNGKNNRPNRQASDNEDESDDDHPEKLLLSMKELRVSAHHFLFSKPACRKLNIEVTLVECMCWPAFELCMSCMCLSLLIL